MRDTDCCGGRACCSVNRRSRSEADSNSTVTDTTSVHDEKEKDTFDQQDEVTSRTSTRDVRTYPADDSSAVARPASVAVDHQLQDEVTEVTTPRTPRDSDALRRLQEQLPDRSDDCLNVRPGSVPVTS